MSHVISRGHLEPLVVSIDLVSVYYIQLIWLGAIVLYHVVDYPVDSRLVFCPYGHFSDLLVKPVFVATIYARDCCDWHS